MAVQGTGLGWLAEMVLENKRLDGQSRGTLVLAVAYHRLAVCATTFRERKGTKCEVGQRDVHHQDDVQEDELGANDACGVVKSELVTHTMSWRDKDKWSPMQFPAVDSCLKECCTRSLSTLVGSPASPPFPIPCCQDSIKLTAPSMCSQPASTQAVPQTHGPTHCGTARFLILKDCSLPHALRTHPAKRTHYMQKQCSSASRIVLGAVRKAACFLSSLPLSPVTIPTWNTQQLGSLCLYQTKAGCSKPNQNCSRNRSASKAGKRRSAPVNDGKECPKGMCLSDLLCVHASSS